MLKLYWRPNSQIMKIISKKSDLAPDANVTQSFDEEGNPSIQ